MGAHLLSVLSHLWTIFMLLHEYFAKWIVIGIHFCSLVAISNEDFLRFLLLL